MGLFYSRIITYLDDVGNISVLEVIVVWCFVMSMAQFHSRCGDRGMVVSVNHYCNHTEWAWRDHSTAQWGLLHGRHSETDWRFLSDGSTMDKALRGQRPHRQLAWVWAPTLHDAGWRWGIVQSSTLIWHVICGRFWNTRYHELIAVIVHNDQS